MEQIGLAIIGTGEIAQNFHLPILKKVPNAKIVAIYDINTRKAELVAERYDIPYSCQSLNEIFEIDGINGVIIATPTDTHSELAIQCLEGGKDIFIEKPIARNYDETLLIAETARKTNRKVMVGMNQRFRNDSIYMKNYLVEGSLGQIFYSNAGWLQQKRDQQWLEQIVRSGGGVLIDLGISLIDLILWFNDFKKVKSVKANIFNYLTKPAEDVAIGSIQFEDGSIGTFESSWTLFRSRKTFFCDVYGEKGRVSINPFNIFNIESKTTKTKYQITSLQNILALKKSFENELTNFINVLQGIGYMHSTIDESLVVMKVIEKMYQSAHELQEVLYN